MENNSDILTDKRKILSILSHASILLGVTGIPIIIPLTIVIFSEDAIVIKNAKEVLNFCITYYILGIIAWLLVFFIIGIPLLIWIIISSWIKPIIAIYRISQNSNYIHYYSSIFRLI